MAKNMKSTLATVRANSRRAVEISQEKARAAVRRARESATAGRYTGGAAAFGGAFLGASQARRFRVLKKEGKPGSGVDAIAIAGAGAALASTQVAGPLGDALMAAGAAAAAGALGTAAALKRTGTLQAFDAAIEAEKAK